METQEQKLQRLEEFMEEVRKLVRNSGRTNFLALVDIDKLLAEYGAPYGK